MIPKRMVAVTTLVLLFGALALARTAPASPADDPVFVGAGDIADCDVTEDEATATLLDGIDGTVFTLGDNAYESGSEANFNECYDPTWGRHKDRTRPSPGNHDEGPPYYAYFGEQAGPPDLGYYSYDLGAWHIISLNSEVDVGAGSAQEQWLRADLAAHPAVCTLAYWHRPRFNSGNHGNSEKMQAVWDALYEYEADVVLNGHAHDYERFALQNPDGVADPERGIREFVVGTGGRYLVPFDGTVRDNSEIRNSDTWGVLKLTLHAASYDWEFIPIAGQTFTDSGSAACVGADGPTPTPPPTPGPYSVYLSLILASVAP